MRLSRHFPKANPHQFSHRPKFRLQMSGDLTPFSPRSKGQQGEYLEVVMQGLAAHRVDRPTVLALAAGLRDLFADVASQVPNHQEVLRRVESLKIRGQEILQFLVDRFIRNNMSEFTLTKFEKLPEVEKDAYRILALQDATTSYTWGEALFSALNLPESFETWRFALPLTIPEIAHLIHEKFGEAKFGTETPKVGKPGAVGAGELEFEKQIAKFNADFVAEIKKATQKGLVPQGLSPTLDGLKKMAGRSMVTGDFPEFAFGGAAIAFWGAGIAGAGWGLFFHSQNFWFGGLLKGLAAAVIGALAVSILVSAAGGLFQWSRKALICAAKKTLDDAAAAIRRHLLQQNDIVLHAGEVGREPLKAEMAIVSGKWRLIIAQGLESKPTIKTEIEGLVSNLGKQGHTAQDSLGHFAEDLNGAKVQGHNVSVLLHLKTGAFLGIKVDQTIHFASVGQKNLLRILLKELKIDN